MNHEVGIFDLATLTENPGKRKTARGTSNYLALGVLPKPARDRRPPVGPGPSSPLYMTYHPILEISATRSD